jgi:hypothetical protein
LEAGYKQRKHVRVLDFAIRAAVMAMSTESVEGGRLLYRPDFTLLTYALDLGLLKDVNISGLCMWQKWDWDEKRVQELCGPESVADGSVDAKSVLSSIVKGVLRGTDHALLSDEEAESMEMQLEDLEHLQKQTFFRSSYFADYRDWVERSLLEYELWNEEVRSFDALYTSPTANVIRCDYAKGL